MYKYILLVLILFPYILLAQKNINEKISFPMISAAYMVQIPSGDISKNFGVNSNIGFSISWKFKSNLLLELNPNFIFGNNLKGDAARIFDSIKTSNGMIINMHGEYAKVRTFERGYFMGMRVGYIYSLKKPNPNSGILFSLGGGILQHKIRIENDGNNVPQVINKYKLGYDKMRYGFSLTQFIGYVYFSKSQITNFYVGIEFYQAWTKSGRSWDFNLMKRDNNKYLDMLHSIKFGWIIPIYSKEPQEYYYY